MPWRPKIPSPTWRSFLRNHLSELAAIDMFVVATATFRLLYTLIMLSLDLDRRRVVHFEVTPNPTQSWLSGQMTEVLPCSCSILAELVNIASVARLVPSNAKRRVSFAPHLRESFEPVH